MFTTDKLLGRMAPVIWHHRFVNRNILLCRPFKIVNSGRSFASLFPGSRLVLSHIWRFFQRFFRLISLHGAANCCIMHIFTTLPKHASVHQWNIARYKENRNDQTNFFECSSKLLWVLLHSLDIPGAVKKNNPLQKSHYFQNNLIFFGEIFRGYSWDI